MGWGQLFNPVALRKAKIVYNFGLSECNRVMKRICLNLLPWEQILSLRVDTPNPALAHSLERLHNQGK